MTVIDRRTFVGSSLASLTALTSAGEAARAQAGAASTVAGKPDVTALVDPDLLHALGMRVSEVMGRLPSVDEARASGRPIELREFLVPAQGGDPDVRVLGFLPMGRAAPIPAMIYIHGGGYTGGTIEMTIRDCMDYAEFAGCATFSVDYRLAPATPYPGSLNDIYSVLKWLSNNAGVLGIDNSRIGVAGFSAGGGHAAALAILARDNGGPALACQVLSAPMLDDRTGSSVAPGAHVGQINWTADQNRAGWEALLAIAPGGSEVPVGAVPARQPNLSGLPPAYVLVGQLDLFLDEAMSYANRLMHAGVWTELRVFPGAFHGCDLMVPDAPVSRAYRTSQVEAIRKAFTLVA